MRELTLDMAPDADGARRAAQNARELLDGADPESAFSCELAVAEACANVVEHASSPRLRVVLRRGPGHFAVAVCDAGAPFEPDAAPGFPPPEAERGRGIALMAECMDRIRVVRRDGENRLLMARRLPRPSDEVTLDGRVDLRAADAVRGTLAAALAAAGGSLLVDLSAVEFIDSSGLAVLAEIHRAAARLGGAMVVVVPDGPARAIFTLTRTDGWFRLADSRAAARAALAEAA